MLRAQLDQRIETRLPSFSVAVKEIKGNATAAMREDLMGEAVIMAQFDHVNVIGLHGVVMAPDCLMIVMQLCERVRFPVGLPSVRPAGACPFPSGGKSPPSHCSDTACMHGRCLGPVPPFFRITWQKIAEEGGLGISAQHVRADGGSKVHDDWAEDAGG